MKKSKTFFACAMLAALASCSNDHVLSQQSPAPSDPDVINIVAASSKPVTRAVEDATNLQNTQFVENEQINVYLKEVTTTTPVITYSAKVYNVSSNNGTETGSLVLTPSDGVNPKFPSNEHGVLAYAFYPSTVSETTDDNTATFTVELDQSKDVDYKKSDLMFGTNNYNTEAGENYGNPIESFKGTKKGNQVPLYFKHQLSKITVIMNTTSFDTGFLNNATIKLYGAKKACTYKAGKDGITEITATTDLGASESYNLGTYNAAGNSGIIVPQTITKDTKFIEITTSGSESKTYVYKIADENGMQFDGGKQYTYTISLSGGNLVVVSVKIENWNNVDKTGTADLQPGS